jgi:hypothetical protein
MSCRSVAAVAVLITSALVSACGAPPAPVAEPAAAPALSPVERGEYIVTTGFCHDCHTPMKVGPNGPEPDMSRALSGHPEGVKVSMPKLPAEWPVGANQTFTAWAGPWGVSFSANITSDQNTGLGVWTEEMFIKAMREGKHMGAGRPILPPMPWPYVAQRTDDELRAVFAYLKTVKAVTNHVPDPILPVGGAM